jgi:hypothetical protein
MTAGQQIMHGTSGGSVVANLNLTVNSNGSGVTASARFNTDGSITYVQSGGAASGPANWFSPPGGTPGNSYWVRFNVTSGALTQNDAPGFTALTTNRIMRLTVAGLGVGSANGTIQVAADAGGVTILGSGTFSISCN